MKILYAGNIANIGYLVAKQLRANSVDIDLLLENRPIVEQDPAKQDPELQNVYPQWVRFYEKNSSGWKRNIMKTMRKYDLIESQYEHNIFAYFSRRPIVSRIVGDDLRDLAFSSSLRGFLMRRALRRARAVLFSTPAELALLARLKIKNMIFLPLFADVEFFKPVDTARGDFTDKFVVFHPANLWSLKGNSILVKGFAEFIKDDSDAILIMIDRGPDSKVIHDLVDKLDISRNVHFLKGPLNSVELRHYYNISDVIADQFVVPEIGGIGREALCCQKPLLTLFDEAGYEKLFGEKPPVINASNHMEILDRLNYLKDAKVRMEIGKKGRDWACKHHSLVTYSKKLLAIYEGILDRERIDRVRDRLSEIS
ncbi:MAG: glycosyltransferase [Thaumarchaeota archaeon]|nr:glycosyltransferase [Nitrososphaerota archaeon]